MVYQGQFGEFTITEGDRKGVVVYRTGLMVAAISFAIGSTIVLYNNNFGGTIDYHLLTPLYTTFMLGIGVSLFTIHIYMAALHRALQAFWLIGCISSFIFGHFDSQPFVVTIYTHPPSILGVGFSFAALTGIYFKEAFCFNRFETKILTPIIPLLLLGHLAGVLPTQWEQIFLGIWALLFMVFAVRKAVQAIPPDIGDKSVFEYLKSQRLAKAS
jgi:uncharacterized integral membrane protein